MRRSIPCLLNLASASRLCVEQTAQHHLENSAIAVVLDLHWAVDAGDDLECDRRSIG